MRGIAFIANPTINPVASFEDPHIVRVIKWHSGAPQTRDSSSNDANMRSHSLRYVPLYDRSIDFVESRSCGRTLNAIVQ